MTVALLRRRALPVLFLLIASVAIVAGKAFLATPLYTAHAVIEIGPPVRTVTPADRAAELATGRTWDEHRLHYGTQARLLETRAVAVDALLLLQGTEAGDAFRTASDPVAALMAARSVAMVPDTRLVRVSVEHASALVAEQTANALCTAYIERQRARMREMDPETGGWSSDAWVVDPAIESREPSSPRPFRAIGIALLVAACAALPFAWALDCLDRWRSRGSMAAG